MEQQQVDQTWQQQQQPQGGVDPSTFQGPGGPSQPMYGQGQGQGQSMYGQGQGQGQAMYGQGQGEDGLPRNLWVGELQYWMDENYLWNCFAHTGELQAVKIIRNKLSGQSEGYGFVEFSSHATAQMVLQTYSGAMMPQTEQPFKLNWAAFGGGHKQHHPAGPEFSIFVGDLADDVTDYVLTDTFRVRYPSVKGAKVVVDMASGRSKGYGFVRFGAEEERDRALVEMNGQYCTSRPMRISIATPKVPRGTPGTGARPAGPPSGQGQGDDDVSNTTIFVGGLDATVTEDQLRALFSPFGDLVYVKIPVGKGCGFVQFVNRSSAEAALHNLHGTQMGSQAIRLSWGRNPSTKRHAAAPGYQSQSQAWQQQSQDQYSYYGSAGAAQGAGMGGGNPYAAGYDAAAAASGYGVAADPSGGYGYGVYGYGGGYSYPQQQSQVPALPGAPPAAAVPQFSSPAAAPAGPSTAQQPTFDPTQPPNVDKMNTQFMASHEAGLVAHHLLLPKPDAVTV